MTVPRALVLAAGKSTRIQSVSQNLPKPLLQLAGESVLAHNLRLLAKYKVKTAYINLFYEPEKIKAAVGDGHQLGIEVCYSHEKEILGTAGAVKNLEEQLNADDFFLLYGDNFTNCDLAELLALHKKQEALATIAVFHQEKNCNSKIAGGKIVLDATGKIESFLEGEAAKLTASPWVNGGVYVLNPKIFSYLPQGFSDFGKDIFPKLLAAKEKLQSYPMRGFCLAMDTPESYAFAAQVASEVNS